MSEHFPLQNERHEQLPAPEQYEALPTAEQAEPLRRGEKDPRLALQEAREQVHESISEKQPALTAKDHLQELQAPAEPSVSSAYIGSQLKNVTLRRELKQIRSHLSMPQRVFSRLVHQPVVRTISEGTAKTVSRPTGLLGAGLMAFIGTSAYLYLARHMGFPYNSGVFLALFVGGFTLGLLLELLVHLATRHRRST